MTTSADDLIQAIYHADSLCGWCFAIADELSTARHELGDRVDWTLRMGGLVVDDRVREIAHDADYLRAGLAQVETVSGRVASNVYWNDVVEPGTWVSDSEPVCRAVLVAMELAGPDAGFIASHRFSDLLYIDGIEPDSYVAVRDVARSIGVDGDTFIEAWESEPAATRLTAHWAQTRQMGLQTYPTIAVRTASSLVPVVTGFATADVIATQLLASAT